MSSCTGTKEQQKTEIIVRENKVYSVLIPQISKLLKGQHDQELKQEKLHQKKHD